MPTENLFAPLPPEGEPLRMVTIEFNGAPLALLADAPLAAGLLAAGVRRFRASPVGGGARAPYCMSGVCFECLLEIDGVPSQQACQVQAREGMKVRAMNNVPGVCTCGGSQHD
ncbi:hypothetical protein FACS1894158_18980 [Betaproteobacteria bacterium]|nr:hypothetical protein FACS1894158_18980 [Betaproteobacteria bacterium]